MEDDGVVEMPRGKVGGPPKGEAACPWYCKCEPERLKVDPRPVPLGESLRVIVGLRASTVVAMVLSDFTVQVDAEEIFLPCL